MPRLTSHGEVVYEQTSNGRLVHPFWGKFEDWWPGEAKPDMGRQQQAGKPGCGACQKAAQGPPPPPAFPSVEAWFDAVAAHPSDFHEHMPTLRDLARGSEVCVELSAWLKPALLAMAAGRPRVLRSYCQGVKPEWGQLKQLLGPGTEFVSVQADSLAAEPVPHQLLFIDTQHQAGKLLAELERWAPHCTGRVLIHCTRTFGERGDDGGPGVLPAIRQYLKTHPEWTVKRHYPNNHGLIVLTRDAAEKKELPPLWKQGWNVLKASWRAGENVLKDFGPLAGTEAQERRLALCTLCESRNGDRCGECGCPVDRKSSWPQESCPLGLWHAEEEGGKAA